MKTLQNLKSVAIALFALGLLLFIGCSRTETPLGSEGTKTELSETFLNSLGKDVTLDESQPIFVEHFELNEVFLRKGMIPLRIRLILF